MLSTIQLVRGEKICFLFMLNSFAGYASDFKESSFDQVEGIKQLEEDFFPHEDLVRWHVMIVSMVKCQTRLAPPNAPAGAWGLQSKRMTVAGEYTMFVSSEIKYFEWNQIFFCCPTDVIVAFISAVSLAVFVANISFGIWWRPCSC